MILQHQQPRRVRPLTTVRRGPPIRVGTQCGRGSTNLAPPRATIQAVTVTPSTVITPKGFRRDIVTLLERKDTPALTSFAAAVTAVLYGMTDQKRARGKIRTAFEAMMRDERYLEHAAQGAIDACSEATSAVPSRVYHLALEFCATHAANKDRWQDHLSKMMGAVHDDALTFDTVALELLEN